ncbi:hypothetical protein BgiMline_036481, partial [Biomphalaria glabrata]
YILTSIRRELYLILGSNACDQTMAVVSSFSPSSPFPFRVLFVTEVLLKQELSSPVFLLCCISGH